MLPSDDTDLAIPFTCPEYQYIETVDNDYVEQCATNDFIVFLGKNQNTNNTDQIGVTVSGTSDLAPSSSTVYLQIYNQVTTNWETLDLDNTTGAGTAFYLSGSTTTSGSDYYASGNWASCRVYQEVQ